MLDRRRSRTPATRLFALGVLLPLACSADVSPFQVPDPQVPTTPVAVAADTSIQMENRQPGNADYYSTRWASPKDLMMWASPYAPHLGDTVDVHIHATKGPVSVTVYRIGWYGGAGARIITKLDAIPAGPQPACTTTEPVVCPWSITARIPVAASWLSGLYLLRVEDKTTSIAYYPFMVSDPSPAPFIAVIPQFTWQAYNDFNERSLYTYTAGVRGHKVSFERPYTTSAGASFVLAHSHSHELSVAQWMERMGYNVHYVSDLDLATTQLRPTRALLFVGHDEYWTNQMRASVEAARDRGTHLMFFSANNGYRAIHLGPGTARAGHLISSYNSDVDPEANGTDVSAIFREPPLNRPENALYGVQFSRTALFAQWPRFAADSVSGPEATAFLKAGGVAIGDTIPGMLITPVLSGEASLEGDNLFQNGRTPADMQVLLRISLPYNPRSEGTSMTFHTTFFRAKSGAGVFASGFNEWGRWLSDYSGPQNAAIQGITKSVLDWMLTH
ncbi:MAG: N,N-dimethylformamidase beta subunit family domain-containing protein [Gemmatimonadota bacterium]